jgi:hypothetical protein
MNAKWFSIFTLVAAGTLLLSASSCGDPQELVSISVQPNVETIGQSTIPVSADAGIQVQLKAYGTYVHPPVTKDITDQVSWLSNTTQMFTVSSTGLLTTTGDLCGGTLISATVTTNSDGSGLSSSGADVVGYMTANVVCFTGTGSGGTQPTLTVSFAGTGTGTVSSSPLGLSCASTAGTCSASFASGTTVTLIATPIGSSTFAGWSGDCGGTTTCNIDLSENSSVTATFD